MPGSRLLVQWAWSSPGNGALFSTTCKAQPIRSIRVFSSQPHTQIRRKIPIPLTPVTSLSPRTLRTVLPRWPINQVPRRILSGTRALAEVQRSQGQSYKEEVKSKKTEMEEDDEDEVPAFKKSEKATQAAQLNLRAKLSKDGTQEGKAGGFREVMRLLKISLPEKKPLSWAFLFLIISSAVSMSVPFSIGKILDVATQSEDQKAMLFGLNITTFYLTLGSVLALGAAANYSRIIILRIVGERIVTRLRSQLFRRTFIQDAEFFDANRVGDLISRLSSDTIIVGKSITQNLSDGLRSFVSGAAGLTLMGYVSLKLTGILALMFPPVAVGAFFYGRAIRNLSRQIQKNLGSLTKIAEERLGNVRTSQAFAGEIQE
ncbi:multidrug-resistance transporter mdr2, partial [Oleoguttula sp. CCFEE 6159]